MRIKVMTAKLGYVVLGGYGRVPNGEYTKADFADNIPKWERLVKDANNPEIHGIFVMKPPKQKTEVK